MLASHRSLQAAFNDWKAQKILYDEYDNKIALVFDAKVNKDIRLWSDGNVMDDSTSSVNFINIEEYEKKYA